MEDILVPIAFFAMLAAIFVLPAYFRSRSRQRLLETLQAAYAKGQPVTPELMETLTDAHEVDRRLPHDPGERAERDLRGGVITVAVALGMIVLGWALSFDDEEIFYVLSGAAAIPGFIGLALIAFGLIGRSKSAI